MSNFERVRKIKEEKRQKSDTRREKLAGYFFDLSKLTFAALVVGCFTPVNDTVVINGWVLAVGSALTIVFAVIASIIIKNNPMYLLIFFSICLAVAGVFLIWLYTKPGKKWLNDL